MKNKIGTILLFVGLIVIIGGAALLYNLLQDKVETQQLAVDETVSQNKEKEETTKENTDTKADQQELTKAFDFTVYDEAGNAYKLSEFEGKPVVLNFWASWCGPCKSEMPDFEEAYGVYAEKIHFLMVNMTDGYQETVEQAKEMIINSGYTFPVYYDTDMEAARAYSVYSIPTTYFIDKDGYVVAYAQGALDMATLQKGIDLIYSE